MGGHILLMARSPSACIRQPASSRACALRQGTVAVVNAQAGRRTGRQPSCMLCVQCTQCLGAKGIVQCELCARCELCSINRGGQ